MIWLFRRIRRDFPHWERPAKVSFLLALGLLVLMLVVILVGPQELRVPALIGGGGLLLVLQATVLWANRGMVTPWTQAQRHYLVEEFEQAATLLETLRRDGQADARTLTLLGNTYRQLGLLDESRAALYEALDKAPNHHYPLYGFGRTLLSEGHYGDAADVFQRALAAGAPAAVGVDLAEAYYRAGQGAAALSALQTLDADALTQEPHRQLMAEFLRYRLGDGSLPDTEIMRSGAPYWRATAERFAHTPYGSDLARDLEYMHGGTE